MVLPCMQAPIRRRFSAWGSEASNMISRILNSNFLAICVLALAAYSVILLYTRGWPVAAYIGAGLWIVAFILIVRGIIQQRKEKKESQYWSRADNEALTCRGTTNLSFSPQDSPIYYFYMGVIVKIDGLMGRLPDRCKRTWCRYSRPSTCVDHMPCKLCRPQNPGRVIYQLVSYRWSCRPDYFEGIDRLFCTSPTIDRRSRRPKKYVVSPSG